MYGNSMGFGAGMGGYSGFGGAYGGGYGGMNSMAMTGMMPGGPQDQSWTQTWNQSTAATFQVMESIVRAFGGLAQMLESAYMTTHSSFFGKYIAKFGPSGANVFSHCLDGGAVGKPQTNAGLSTRHIHPSTVDENADR